MLDNADIVLYINNNNSKIHLFVSEIIKLREASIKEANGKHIVIIFVTRAVITVVNISNIEDNTILSKNTCLLRMLFIVDGTCTACLVQSDNAIASNLHYR